MMHESNTRNLCRECRVIGVPLFRCVEEQGSVFRVRVCRGVDGGGERCDRVKEGSFVDGYGGVEDPEDVVFGLIDRVVDVVDFRVDADRFGCCSLSSA